MNVASTAADGVRSARLSAHLPALVMAGACLNAFVVRAAEAWVADGQLSLTFGISPFVLVTAFVATKLLLASPAGDDASAAMPWWLDAAALALILVPSSAVSWLALAGYALVVAQRSNGDRRVGAALFVALAASQLWSSILLKWLAGPVTLAEGSLLAAVVSLLRADIVQFGNVIGDPAGHSLVLMTRCTTSDALPAALVALAAIACLLGAPDRGRMMAAAVVLAVAVAITNLIRLSLMAWSADAYELVHGPIGANIYDGLHAGLVIALGHWASGK